MSNVQVDTRFSVLREGKDEEKRVGSAVLTLLTMLSAIGACIVLSFTWKARKSDFYGFMAYVLHVMQELPYIQDLLTGAFICSLALFLSSLFTSIASLLDNPRLAKFGLALCLLSAGAMIGGGAYSFTYVGSLDSSIVDDSGAGSMKQNDRFNQLLDFSMAMYNGCCLAKSGLGPYVNPQVASDEVWGFLTPANIDAYTSSTWVQCSQLASRTVDKTTIVYALSSCYNSNSNLQWFDHAVTDQMCTVFDKTKVDITGTSLQGYELDKLTNGVTELVLRGKAKAGVLGCGGGKLKAFQFLLYLWFQSVCRPVSLALLIVGTISFLIILFGIATTCLSSNEDIDVDIRAVENYMQRSDVRHAAMAALELNNNNQEMMQVVAPIHSIDDKI